MAQPTRPGLQKQLVIPGEVQPESHGGKWESEQLSLQSSGQEAGWGLTPAHLCAIEMNSHIETASL